MHLNGAEALEYARTRHTDNDYARNTRQQQIILAIREQALKTNLFPKATSLIDVLSDAFRTDLPRDQWLGFAYFAKGLSNKDIAQFSLTDLLYDNPQNGIYYSAIDWPKAIARMKEFSPKENTDYLNAMGR